jgi:hypothetical protein
MRASLHSIPRATRDIDIVIFPNRDQLTRFLRSLPADRYYSDLEDAIDALKRQNQFNVIDHATGWKIDSSFLRWMSSMKRSSIGAGGSTSMGWN